MNKRGLCIVNAILSIVLFLLLFGYVCYRGGVPGHEGSDFKQWIWVCIYYAVLLVLTIGSVHLTYFSKKYYFVVAIYSLLFCCFLIILWILAALKGFVEGAPIWVAAIMSILTPIISGLYFYGAFAKSKRDDIDEAK